MFNASEVEVTTVLYHFPVTGLCVDHENNLIGASADQGVIFSVPPGYGEVRVLVGDNDSSGLRDSPLKPVSVCTDNEGNLLVADQRNNKVKMIDKQRQNVITLAGAGENSGFNDGPALSAQFNRLVGIHVSPLDGTTAIADVDNGKIRLLKDGTVITLISGCYPNRICSDPDGNLIYSDFRSNTVRKISRVDGSASILLGKCRCPRGVCMDFSGNIVVVDSAKFQLKSVSRDGVVRRIAGCGKGDKDGVGSEATFGDIYDVCCDEDGNLLVSDYGNKSLRKIVLGAHYMRTVSEQWPSNHKLFLFYKQKCIETALLSFLQFHLPKEIQILLIKSILLAKHHKT